MKTVMAKDETQPKKSNHRIPERPRVVPRTPAIEKMVGEIKGHGFTCEYMNSHEGWLIKEVNGDIVLKGRYLDGMGGLYEQWKAKVSGVPAMAPAEIAEEPETEDLAEVTIDADPATGQQYLAGQEVVLPKGLARVVIDEWEKKEKFVSANAEYQEAIKARKEETQKPIYSQYFRPVPDKHQPKDKNKRVEFLRSGHVCLVKTVTTSKDVDFSVLHVDKCDWLKEPELKEAA